jgi:alanine racemase
MAATDAAYLYNESQFDAVRIGAALYGYSDVPEFEQTLKPVLSFKSQIASLKRVAKGESVSYDRIYKAPSPRKIAIVPAGYYDGYPRVLSNKAEVLVAGSRAKVVGRICMNSLMIDVTGVNCGVGDEVILIGSQKEESVLADELGSIADTNSREILSRLSPLISREYHFK